MSEQIEIDGTTLSPAVLEKIVSVAATGIDGVSALGGAGIAGLVQKAGRHEIDVALDESGGIVVTIHIQVTYGRPIRDIAADVRCAVSDAITGQVGRPVSAVDIFVDAISFDE
ncbi:MAG: Asp23/Gls24 family envelope stress response protein [Actinobacteria bacterium]|nr:MAG: Asp23/Gls24 family envelope stress response protein [Actinomycetota bacterium]